MILSYHGSPDGEHTSLSRPSLLSRGGGWEVCFQQGWAETYGGPTGETGAGEGQRFSTNLPSAPDTWRRTNQTVGRGQTLALWAAGREGVELNKEGRLEMLLQQWGPTPRRGPYHLCPQKG